MALAQELATERLRLPLWTADDVSAIRSGTRLPWWHAQFPRDDDLDACSLWRDGDPWSSRSITVDDVAVGSIGFYGPPQPAVDGTPEAEIGYGLVEAARGAGYATEAVDAMVAAAEATGARVRASVAPDNRASLRVLAKCGFTELRGSNEDGELVMARPLR
jgi:[ribosomal protein S5]-alanine N-acetyltransferase